MYTIIWITNYNYKTKKKLLKNVKKTTNLRIKIKLKPKRVTLIKK